MKTVYEIEFGYINDSGVDSQYEFSNVVYASESIEDVKEFFAFCCKTISDEWWKEYETSGHKNADGRYYDIVEYRVCDDFDCENPLDEIEYITTLDVVEYTIEDASIEKNDSIFVVNKGLYKSNSIE